MTEITRENIATIKNRRLSNYAAIYLRIGEPFGARVRGSGLEFDSTDERTANAERIRGLGEMGAVARNDAKSICLKWISPANVACQTGLGSVTYFVLLQCHRACFFCFNPNQEGYDYFKSHTRDCLSGLNEIARPGARPEHVALTGGQPLLHRAETIEFFRAAAEKLLQIYKRLYTSGDHCDAELGEDLSRSHLDEIRFSIRLHDSPNARAHTLKQLARARPYIPRVMVEMPVLPDARAEMKDTLLELERLEISGLNQLGFCFPLNNAAEYRRRGYRIKAHPYRVLYDYTYADGLPFAGSKATCLELVGWAKARKLKLGVHYCSLESKHSGEIYQRHQGRRFASHLYLSPKDYFLKSAKGFGRHIQRVLPVFEKSGYRDLQRNREHYIVEFHLRQIEQFRDQAIEIGISTRVPEPRGRRILARTSGGSSSQSFDFGIDP